MWNTASGVTVPRTVAMLPLCYRLYPDLYTVKYLVGDRSLKKFTCYEKIITIIWKMRLYLYEHFTVYAVCPLCYPIENRVCGQGSCAQHE